jgi:pyruvate,water dikinase
MSSVHWLGDDDCHHDAIVGGKAASLSRLASLHTVPYGFAIAALPAIQTCVPEALAPAIVHAYGALGERCGAVRPAVAVRSSALDEDGADASFAGQHDTYLNIRGTDAVLDAVQRCVRSAISSEAMAYRQERGLPLDDVRIAVLVQQLVPSDVSAVVFSANPITGSRDEVMINSNWGLGESIVGGTVTPDTFVVDKQGLAVTWRDVARKDRMTVMTDAGTAEVDVPDDLRTASSLTDDEVRAMTQLALKLELVVGQPVDIECAIAHGTLYLLQCRPITTLG